MVRPTRVFAGSTPGRVVSRTAQGDSGDDLAGHMRIEDAADGFDLGEFWHDECSGPFGGNETGWRAMPVFLVA
jgi:hypothetical protein